ncbi:RTC4 domain-containing protein [Mycena kentingensis (nom. inval.)]|nr:RTC4 domain-containing protein [Mycena kentingensis (nom. inval.)]
MEAGKYKQTNDRPPPRGQPIGKMHDDYASTYADWENHKPPKSRRDSEFDSDVGEQSPDELDTLSSQSSQAPSKPSRTKATSKQRAEPPKERTQTDVLKTLSFRKKPPGAEKDAPKENSGSGKGTGRAGTRAADAGEEPLRERRNSSPERLVDLESCVNGRTKEGKRRAKTIVVDEEDKPKQSGKQNRVREGPSRSRFSPTPSSQPPRPKPKPKPRNNPRRAGRVILSEEDEDEDEIEVEAPRPKKTPKTLGPKPFPSLQALDKDGDATPKKKPREKPKPVPAPFPMDSRSPPRQPSSTERPSTKSQVSAFPMPSPLREAPPTSSPTKKPPAAFPVPSPLRSAALAKPPKRGGVAPFPMSLNKKPSPGKRRSAELEIEDDTRDKKRTRNLAEAGPSTIPYTQDDSVIVDPGSLCPYCDAPLPSDPTPFLQDLLDRTFKKSNRDPRPANPLGRKAPMAAFIAVCQRHRFESETLPEAEAKGWPKRIDWEDVRRRVQGFEWDLRRIVEDGGGEEDHDTVPSSSQGKKGPRRSCLFWRDMMKELKEKGTKAVQGVQAQFATFHKMQPGYYGEMGSVIIHQALYDMFPLSEISPELVDPLTPNEFIQRILVPEVGMRLVMQDLFLDVDCKEDKKRAVAILQESASYGVAMFPDDSAGTGARPTNVGEKLIMERARRRRRELEEEEREEEEELVRQQSEAEKQERRDRKGKRRAEEVVTDYEVPIASERPRPKPRLKQKQSAMDLCASAAETSGSESCMEETPRRGRSRSRVREPSTRTRPNTRSQSRARSMRSSDADDSEPEVRDVDVRMQSPPPPPSTQVPKTWRAKTINVSSESDSSEADAGVRAISRGIRESSVVEDRGRGRETRSRSRARARTRTGTSVSDAPAEMDLCTTASDSDGAVVASSTTTSKPRRGRTPSRRRTAATNVTSTPTAKRKPDRKGSSVAEDDDAVVIVDEDATPRPAPPKTIPNPLPKFAATSSSSSFRPLDLVRNRAPRKTAGKSTTSSSRSGSGSKKTDTPWLKSMAVDAEEEDEDAPAPNQSRPRWLLDDIETKL